MSHLHKTRLNRERLVEVIACEPPATEMPHFDKYAYEDKSCYGLSADDLGQKYRQVADYISRRDRKSVV